MEYIISSINKEKIFQKYFLNKTKFLKDFFNSVYNYQQDSSSNPNSNNKLFLTENNYDYYINNIENNYSNFSSNLLDEIDETFTNIICLENTDVDSDLISDSGLLISDGNVFKNCSRERYSTDLNYSKYNFNVVKFRTEISNAKRLPEMIKQLIESLNYSNMINPNTIIEIDELINNKNILDILVKTKEEIKKIKNNTISSNQEDFDSFWNTFMNKDGNLTNNYLPLLNLFKEILLGENVFCNNHIEETSDYLLIILVNL